MPGIERMFHRLRALFRRGELEREMDEEIRLHVEMEAAELARNGLSPDEAGRQALVAFGGVERAKEEARDTRGFPWLEDVAQDVGYGLRTLRKNAGTTAVAILTMAIGIGATTAVFTLIDTALLRPAAFPEPDQLVAAQKTIDGAVSGPVSRLDYFDFRDQSRSFEGLAALMTGKAGVTVSSGAEPWVGDVGAVSWNLLRVLRLRPAIGRDFLEEEEAGGGAQVAIISHGLWQRRFGGSPSTVGSSIELNGQQFTVVGVMPSGLRLPIEADVWIAISQSGPADQTRDSHSHLLFGRLKSGVSIRQAQQDVDRIAEGLAQQYPGTNRGKGLRLTGLQEFLVRNIRPALLLVMATTVLVLLIACANVAGLLLARGQRSLPEMAMRTALGATRGRLVRQVLTEGVMLTLSGGLLGVVAARAIVTLLRQWPPVAALGTAGPVVDNTVLVFALAASILTGLLVGVVPAIRGTAVDPSAVLGAGRQALQGARGSRLRSVLVASQVAVSIVLLAGSVLAIRTVGSLTAVDLGFNPEGVFTARLLLSGREYAAPERRLAFFTSVLEGVRARPGVVSAGLISKLPILSPYQDWGIWPAGRPPAGPQDAVSANARFVSPGYFTTIGIPLVRGRDIADGDLAGTPRVIVVSEAVARTVFPGQDPIGRQVEVWSTEGVYTVVGVVGDARLDRALSDIVPAMYMSSAQFGSPASRIVIRTTGDPGQLAAPLHEIVRQADRNVPLDQAATLTSALGEVLGPARAASVSLAVFAAVALLLTAIGLYGVLAYHVSQQENEMGVRLAMGATPSSLLTLVLKRGLALVGSGLALGAVLLVPGAISVRKLPFKMSPQDPTIYVSALLLLSLVAAVACVLPAWRATRVNPIEVLRRE